MAAKLLLLFACDYANADKDNKINANGIFDLINTAGKNNTFANFFVAAQLQLDKPDDDRQRNVKITVVDPIGRTISEANSFVPNNVNFTKNINILAKFNLVNLQAKGFYSLQVLVDGILLTPDYKIEVQ